MRHFLFSAGIKLLLATLLICSSHYVVNHSNFYYLVFGNVLLLFGLAFLVEGIVFLLLSVIKRLRDRKKAIISTSRSTFIVLFLADLIIRLTGIMQTYPERSDGNYFSIAQQEKLDSWYWVHTPSTKITNQKKEFLFIREVNSIGISEKELPKEKGTKFRIMAIGDSFTEGVGTNYEDSWVKQMEHRWKSKNVETINGGIGGSDPVYEFVLYRDKLIDYKPDVLVLTINATDIVDVAGRGGFERFHANGTAGSGSPSWEWIYATNHLFRLTIHAGFGYNTSLLRGADTKKAQLIAIDNLKEVLKRIKKLSSEEDTKLLVVLQPSIQEFNNGKHTPFFGQKELINYMKSQQISFLDTSNDFKKKGSSISEYYYPLDTHFNKKGYALFGKSVYEKIEELGVFDS